MIAFVHPSSDSQSTVNPGRPHASTKDLAPQSHTTVPYANQAPCTLFRWNSASNFDKLDNSTTREQVDIKNLPFGEVVDVQKLLMQ